MASLSPLPGSARVRAGLPLAARPLRAASTLLVASLLLAACAGLLEIPEDPRLAPTASAIALEPQPDAAVAAIGAVPGTPAEQMLAPSSASESDGPRVSVIAEQTAEQMRPSTPMPAEEPDAGAATIPDPPPPTGAAGATGTEPPDPPPSVCGVAQSQGPNGRCFALLSTALSWPESRQSCRALGQGWDLAVPRNLELNAFLATLISDEAWIGGTDQDAEGVWRWVDDDGIFWQGDEAGAAPGGAFANWNPTEPNGAGNSDCLRLVVRVGNEWADLECEMPRSALCEGPVP
ncbi:MAG: hypothetical protein RL685_4319 [Pseudomonadota bacterium]